MEPEETKKEAEEMEEEPEWFDEEEPEESEAEESQELKESEEADSESGEEPEWFDEEEPEESETEGSKEPEESEEAGSDSEEEPEWFDEEEPEESEAEGSKEPEESEEADSDSGEEPEWFDEEEPEESEAEESEKSEDSGEKAESEGRKEPAETEDSGEGGSDSEEEPEWFDEEESDEIKVIGGLGAAAVPAMEEELDFEEAEWLDEDETEGFGEEGSGFRKKPEESGAWRKHRKLWIILIIIAAAIVAVYVGFGIFFKYHFLPNTEINGINCSYMTVDELKDEIQAGIHEYELQITERKDGVETIYGADFDLHAVYDETLPNILSEQGAFKWPAAFFNSISYDPKKTVEWDEVELQNVLDNLDCTNTSKMINPKDAEIVFSEDEDEFVIIPAEYGTLIKSTDFENLIDSAVASLTESVDLEEEGCYQSPRVTEESPEMEAACKEMNRMIQADITYNMLDIENVHIPREEMSKWITVDNNLEVAYNEDAIAEYVADFAQQYDTRDQTHYLETTWGPTVSASNDGYGWQLDQEGEILALEEDLEAGETIVREPTWAHTAKSHSGNDYGDTYVEINLTAQHLYFYKEGSLIIDTDFVSGRMTQGRETPTGIYYVYYKQTNAVLKGEDYATPVSYWMPFNGGVGLHDATWRGSFGGTIYVNNGSHGCINLPYSAAQTIYENISVGDCVFVYQLEGTESGSE